MSLVNGLHHVSMNCKDAEEFEKVVTFYCDTLGLEKLRTWPNGIMLQAGKDIIEIFSSGESINETGAIRHFAFSVSDVDECAKVLTQAGYQIFNGPKDILIASNPPLPARIVFCHGPLGEHIEFFCEK